MIVVPAPIVTVPVPVDTVPAIYDSVAPEKFTLFRVTVEELLIFVFNPTGPATVWFQVTGPTKFNTVVPRVAPKLPYPRLVKTLIKLLFTVIVDPAPGGARFNALQVNPSTRVTVTLLPFKVTDENVLPAVVIDDVPLITNAPVPDTVMPELNVTLPFIIAKLAVNVNVLAYADALRDKQLVVKFTTELALAASRTTSSTAVGAALAVT